MDVFVDKNSILWETIHRVHEVYSVLRSQMKNINKFEFQIRVPRSH